MDPFLDKIFKRSEKAKLLEALAKTLETADKAIVVTVEDKEGGKYSCQVMTLGLNSTYEACGILEVAKQDLASEDY